MWPSRTLRTGGSREQPSGPAEKTSQVGISCKLDSCPKCNKDTHSSGGCPQRAGPRLSSSEKGASAAVQEKSAPPPPSVSIRHVRPLVATQRKCCNPPSVAVPLFLADPPCWDGQGLGDQRYCSPNLDKHLLCAEFFHLCQFRLLLPFILKDRAVCPA